MANEKWCYFNRGATQEYDANKTRSYCGNTYTYDKAMQLSNKLKYFRLPSLEDIKELEDKVNGFFWIGEASGIMCKVRVTNERQPFFAFGALFFMQDNFHKWVEFHDYVDECGFWLQEKSDIDDGMATAVFMCIKTDNQQLHPWDNGPFKVEFIYKRIPKKYRLPIHLVLE